MPERDGFGIPTGTSGNASGTDASRRDAPEAAALGTDSASATADSPDALTDQPDAAEEWMLRDDEFLLEADREYVLRDRRSLWDYVSPVLFGAVVAVMVGDVITTGVGLAMGLEEANPVAGAVIREAGLGGLLVLKAMAAVVLLTLPALTDSARRTFRAGSVAYLFVGLAVLLSNAWAILAVAG